MRQGKASDKSAGHRHIRHMRYILFGIIICLPVLLFGQPKDGIDGKKDGKIQRGEALTFYINAQSKSKNQNGSSEAPFNSLQQAFSSIKKGTVSRCTFFLAPGTYKQKSLEISCDTTLQIWKKGSTRRPVISNTLIHNSRGYELCLQNISLDKSRLQISGNGKTLLKDVDISYASENALSQDGGKLSMTNVTVMGTRATGKGDYSGTALHLSGGITGVLKDVVLTRNENGALRIDGINTRVYARNLEVKENGWSGVNPLLYGPGSAAVVASGKAILYLEDGVISDNEFLGILIYEGGKASIRRSSVTHTRSVHSSNDERGGTNIAVCQRSSIAHVGKTELELLDVVSETASLNGLQVIDAWVRVCDTTITRNFVGLTIQTPHNINKPVLNNCFSNSRSTGNETDYSIDGMPVPEGENPLDDNQDGTQSSADMSSCALVPFVVLTVD